MARGFTLVELLVVIAIIAVLAVISSMGAFRFIESGRKVQTLAQFRDVGTGMTMYITDYNKPPIPASKMADGLDTLYGDAGGKYPNGFIIAVLAGDTSRSPWGSEAFDVTTANPRLETYLTMPITSNNKQGVGKLDGNLYDPWGKQIMIVVNGMKGTTKDLDTSVLGSKGISDTFLDTKGFGEYKDTKPKDQSHVCISFGKDAKKGNKGATPSTVVPYAGSDDVISW